VSRRMLGDQSTAFRAVVWVVPYEGEARAEHFGPYASAPAAKGQLTNKIDDNKDWARYRARRWCGDGSFVKDPEDAVTGYIEQSSVSWTRVDDK
jgi:hypothetical protein